MGRVGLKQVPLGSTQLPFPGGWVIRLLSAARDERFEKRRTVTRLKAGSNIERETYREWESKLTDAVTQAFPRVSAINGFAKKYVDEYFRLWQVSAEAAPIWEGRVGPSVRANTVMGRAAVRDLVLRLCYLESGERHLAGSSAAVMLRARSIQDFYALLIGQFSRAHKLTQEKVAHLLSVDPAVVRRWKSGRVVPSQRHLTQFSAAGDQRLSAGVRFLDLLMRRLGLRETPLAKECWDVSGSFLLEHPAALERFRSSRDSGNLVFRKWAQIDGNLLLHAGFGEVRVAMPNAIWRTHLYALQFARPFDLARAYLRFSTKRDDSALESFLLQAEATGSPHRWMEALDNASFG